MILPNVAAYNVGKVTAGYNVQYNKYINIRNVGIAVSGSLSGWIKGVGAAQHIQNLLASFGMNSRASGLVPVKIFHAAIGKISPLTIDWISSFSLPLSMPPCAIVNPASGASLADELGSIYNLLATRGNVTKSGGFVAASKTMHCLFPNLAPMNAVGSIVASR